MMRKLYYGILIALIIISINPKQSEAKTVNFLLPLLEQEAEEGNIEEPAEEKDDWVLKSEIDKLIPSGGLLYINCMNFKSVYKDIKKSKFHDKFISLFGKLVQDIENFEQSSGAKGTPPKKKDDQTVNISVKESLKLLGYDFFLSIYYSEEKKDDVTLLLSTMLKDPSYINQIPDYLEQVRKKMNMPPLEKKRNL